MLAASHRRLPRMETGYLSTDQTGGTESNADSEWFATSSAIVDALIMQEM